jgi:hypothetical protein
MFLAALLAAAAGWGVRLALSSVVPDLHPILRAMLVLGAFGVVYFGVAALLGLREVQGLMTRVRGLRKGRE